MTRDAGDGRLLQRLLPHLERCAQIRLHLTNVAGRAAGLAAALDRLPIAVLTLDAQGRLLHANQPGARLLHLGEPLAVREGRLTAVDGPENERLHRMSLAATLAGCCRAGRHDDPVGFDTRAAPYADSASARHRGAGPA